MGLPGSGEGKLATGEWMDGLIDDKIEFTPDQVAQFNSFISVDGEGPVLILPGVPDAI